MPSIPILKFLEIDPAKIVNNHHSRIVTDHDVSVMEDSFLENGFIPTASPITVRYATAPEICSLYQRAPHKYSLEQAQNLTATIVSKPDFENHVYAYDGLIRKAAVLRLKRAKKIPRLQTLRAMLVEAFGPRQAIAYGLAQNSVNGVAVKLSPIEILLKCREYDMIFNSNRPSPANQTEVARSMIEESLPPGTHEDTKKKLAETRRQIIGVSRKLPNQGIEFLESALRKDVLTSRSAFTIANLKAIPKELPAKHIVSLLSRIEKGYRMHLPKPKALDAPEVKEQAVLALEAHKLIENFQKVCGYDTLPYELSGLCERMASTQKYDAELKEHESSKDLFPPLVDLCKKSVPGGALVIKQLCQEKHGLDVVKEHEALQNQINSSRVTDPSAQPDLCEGLESDLQVDGETETQEKEITAKQASSMINNRDKDVCGLQLPRGWHIEQIDFLEFEKNGQKWDDLVSHVCDFAMMTLLSTDVEDSIRKAVTHLGHALHSTGVAHVFCSISQYRVLETVVKESGMYIARDAMLYIFDPVKVKRLTLAGQTQPIHHCAAIFWREPPSSKDKHYFSCDASCPGSSEPGWVSVVSGLTPMGSSIAPELGSTILRRWCKPGGVCYDATANDFGLAAAARELGIGYIGVEKSATSFQRGTKKLVELFRLENVSPLYQLSQKIGLNPIKRKLIMTDDDLNSATSQTPKKKTQTDGRTREKTLDGFSTPRMESSEEEGLSNSCALRDTCMFYGKGQEPTHSCRCGMKLHNLCDYGRRMPRPGSDDSRREMEWACSSACLDKFWPLSQS